MTESHSSTRFEPTVLPWQQGQWRQLADARRQGRLAHGLMLYGATGLGKRNFAEALAHWLLCSEPGSQGACGSCTACLLIAPGNHPDLFHVVPEEGKKTIQVDAVRALSLALSLTSHAGGMKVAILHPAGAMTRNAANSLLKTLEEPAAGTILILVAERPSQLPATVVSRCQGIRFLPPEIGAARQWLAAKGDPAELDAALGLAGGAPLLAAGFLEKGYAVLRDQMAAELGDIIAGRRDPVAVAAAWSPGRGNDSVALEKLALRLEWLRRETSAAVRQIMAGDRADSLAETRTGTLRIMTNSLNLLKLFDYLDDINKTQFLLAGSINVQLAVENLLIPWAGDLLE